MLSNAFKLIAFTKAIMDIFLIINLQSKIFFIFWEEKNKKPFCENLKILIFRFSLQINDL
jgi:hypothetical protein